MDHKAVATSPAAHPSAMARIAIKREVISAMQKPGLFYWALGGLFGAGLARTMAGPT